MNVGRFFLDLMVFVIKLNSISQKHNFFAVKARA